MLKVSYQWVLCRTRYVLFCSVQDFLDSRTFKSKQWADFMRR